MTMTTMRLSSKVIVFKRVLGIILIFALTEIIDGGDDDSDGEGQRGQITIDRLKDDLFAEEDGLHQGALFRDEGSVAIIKFSWSRSVNTREENGLSAKRN